MHAEQKIYRRLKEQIAAESWLQSEAGRSAMSEFFSLEVVDGLLLVCRRARKPPLVRQPRGREK